MSLPKPEHVLVVPITHTPPKDPSLALEIPPTVKARLNLDDAPSWIVYGEGNRFLWPGPDLRPIPGSHPPEFTYGFLPPKLFAVIKSRMIALKALVATVSAAAMTIVVWQIIKADLISFRYAG